MLNRPASFFYSDIEQSARCRAMRIPLAVARGICQSVASLISAAAQDIRGQKSFGTFHELIFHGFSLVQSPVAIFLNRGKVDEDVFSGGALNEAISFGSVEPLYSSLFFHKCNSFRLSIRLKSPPLQLQRWRKGCCFAGQMALFRNRWLPCRKARRRLQQPDRSASSNCCTKTSTRMLPAAGPPGAEHNIQELRFL